MSTPFFSYPLSNQPASRVFPKDFVWGTASSSFQIEGASDVDGRGPSIWDTFCATPGKIADKTDGRIACDHYHLYEHDLDLMKELGVSAYRFSIAWPRIIPTGTGRVETRGLDFYERLVDAMLKRGITPWVTLYHWDLPQTLQDGGGWTNRATAEAFADYAVAVANRLKGKVKHWITHNEPWCVAVLGHRTGEHAPGVKDGNAALKAAHHVLLSHGLAMTRLREILPKEQLGITLNLNPAWAYGSTIKDRRDAQIFDGDFNRWYLDAVLKGHYPEDMQRHYESVGDIKGDGWSFIKPGDLECISQPMDFLGVNYYTRAVFGRHLSPQEDAREKADPSRYTAMGWEVSPETLEELMVRLHREYPMPAYYITENGSAYTDQVSPDGSIQDDGRTQYLVRHLAALQAASARGVPVKGYFAWSIMDNFEWAHGYAKRFGLVYVDYKTQKRTPKKSFYTYREVVRGNAIP
jgi:beta-glucosidase